MQLNEQTRTTERALGDFSSDIIARLGSNHLDWQNLKGSPQFDYAIDYSIAFIRADRASGQIEFLAKMGAQLLLPFPSASRAHRHLGYSGRASHS